MGLNQEPNKLSTPEKLNSSVQAMVEMLRSPGDAPPAIDSLDEAHLD